MLPRRQILCQLFGLPLFAGAAAHAAVRPGSSAAGAERGRTLRVGAARIDITPDEPVCLEGYQEQATRISIGVHDRLYARAFAFLDGSTRLVLVSCDLASMSFADYFQRRLGESTGLAPDELLLCATHTHSGPFLTLHPSYPANVAYTTRLSRPLAEAVSQALRTARPATLTVGRGRSTIGVNRRKILPGGEVEIAPNPDGVTDPDVLVLQAADSRGRPFAALFDYACHSRSLRAPNRLVSGDILGIAAQEAERTLGGAVVGAFAGASGDVDPAVVVDGFQADGATVPATERQGRELALAVLDAARSARPVVPATGVRRASARLVLPPKTPGLTKTVQATAGSVGNVALVALDCEASVEIGLSIKAASPFPATFVITNCNGGSGYLPVAHQYAEGGYEVGLTGFGPGAAAQLVERITAMLTQLQRCDSRTRSC